mmetsp:Transcript_15698/g.37878  ORF Transcript_15698/g.37878 Transcript_15698/m.37878 type:complete len:485 (+) Transcript_15698:72-1526(+)
MSYALALTDDKGRGKGGGKGDRFDANFQVEFRPARTIDYSGSCVKFLSNAIEYSLRLHNYRGGYQCHYHFSKEMPLPALDPLGSAASPCTHFAHMVVNKQKQQIHSVHWMPSQRKVVTGSSNGELTVWNGLTFNYENILQGHTSKVTALLFTPDESVLISGDGDGAIRLWEPTFAFIREIEAHKETVRDISCSPNGTKFVSCADDSSARVWDYSTLREERQFIGWDVKCCHWHPSKGLVATGSKDNQVKLWDPRAKEPICTIWAHKNIVTKVKWSPDGQNLISGARDHLVKCMDLRAMKERRVFKAHKHAITALTWNPEFPECFVSASHGGMMAFWDINWDTPVDTLPTAHEGAINAMAYSRVAHMLVSVSSDMSTRFWVRARPGDAEATTYCPAPRYYDSGTVEEDPNGVRAATAPVLRHGIFLPPAPSRQQLEELRAQQELASKPKAIQDSKPAPTTEEEALAAILDDDDAEPPQKKLKVEG